MSCAGCIYAILLSREWYCDYLGIKGHRRPCPPGEACTVRAEAEDTQKRGWTVFQPVNKRTWDTEKARTLYKQGLSDAKIAAEVGATKSAVEFWRRKMGFPANRSPRSAPQGPEPMLPSPERPPAAPEKEFPVEISFEADAFAFSLRAQDLKAAVQACGYASTLMQEITALAEKMEEADPDE